MFDTAFQMELPRMSAPAAPATAPAARFQSLLATMVESGASDLFLSVGAAPTMKVAGRLQALPWPSLESGAVREYAQAIMSKSEFGVFERRLEHDMALQVDGVGRFRINVYVQRGEVGMVARHVRNHIPSLDELRLPAVVHELAMLRQGLVLVVGAAGAGKSTTVARMLRHRIDRQRSHLLTIEDPIEFLHEHQESIVDQREVGLDTHSFSEALRHALRQAPDVIMIGEIRDQESLQQAIHFADSGHLCISTLHANNASQTIDRILNFFPEGAREGVLMDLSQNLRGIVALRLLVDKSGARVPATEVLQQSTFVRELLAKGKLDQIKQAIVRAGPASGMHTFDQSIYDLYLRKIISLDCALDHADSRTDLALRARLAAGCDAGADPAASQFSLNASEAIN